MQFDPEAWKIVLRMTDLYHRLSHVSALSLGYQMLFTEEGGLVLGSEFDPAKLKEYEGDVIRRRSAAESLDQIIPIIMNHLPQKEAHGGGS